MKLSQTLLYLLRHGDVIIELLKSILTKMKVNLPIRKQMPSKLDPYKEIICEKLKLCCYYNSIYKFICKKGYQGKYTILSDHCSLRTLMSHLLYLHQMTLIP